MLKNLPADLNRYKFFDVLAALPFVEAIYLYGSRARGDNRNRSDIDLAIRYGDDDPYYRSAVHGILDTADTLLSIDCVDMNKTTKELREAISEEGILLYEQDRKGKTAQSRSGA